MANPEQANWGSQDPPKEEQSESKTETPETQPNSIPAPAVEGEAVQQPQEGEQNEPAPYRSGHVPTRLCRFWARGNCRNGTRCNFLHSPLAPPAGIPVCRFWKRGHCRDGPQCRFRHDFNPQPGGPMPPMNFFPYGYMPHPQHAPLPYPPPGYEGQFPPPQYMVGPPMYDHPPMGYEGQFPPPVYDGHIPRYELPPPMHMPHHGHPIPFEGEPHPDSSNPSSGAQPGWEDPNRWKSGP